MHLAAEVFYLPNLLNISKNPLLTVGNGKYMLIEFMPSLFPKNYENEFYELQSSGIIPIVAHPERYRFVRNDLSILQIWKDRGFVMQLDAGSIIGHFGKLIQKFSFNMLENGFVHIIGSDAHNNKKRNFCIKEAYDIIEKNFSINYVDMLKKNAIYVLKGEDVRMIIFEKKNIFKKLTSFLNRKIDKFND